MVGEVVAPDLSRCKETEQLSKGVVSIYLVALSMAVFRPLMETDLGCE